MFQLTTLMQTLNGKLAPHLVRLTFYDQQERYSPQTWGYSGEAAFADADHRRSI